MSTQPEHRYSPSEYLEMERRADYKSEFFDGEIFAMTGATRKHNLISMNIGAAFHQQLRRRNCETYMNDMRVRVSPTGLYTYPDVVIVCDAPDFDDERHDTLLNPAVIVEVLSESTASYDRGRKFEHYRSLTCFQEYLLVHQDRMYIEHYMRRTDTTWLFSEYRRPDDEIMIEAADCRLRLADIYEKVFAARRTEELS